MCVGRAGVIRERRKKKQRRPVQRLFGLLGAAVLAFFWMVMSIKSIIIRSKMIDRLS